MKEGKTLRMYVYERECYLFVFYGVFIFETFSIPLLLNVWLVHCFGAFCFFCLPFLPSYWGP